MTGGQGTDRGPRHEQEGPPAKNARRKQKNGPSNRDAPPTASGDTQGVEPDSGLTPTLQAHIGRHVRAVFDEVAREPIPEHLLRLLNDLERSGDK